MTYIPDDLNTRIEESVPISCVDFVPVRYGERGTEVGLILRESPFGEVSCHLGGCVKHGEMSAMPFADSLTTPWTWRSTPDPKPMWVYQWFPDELRPQTGLIIGDDLR